MALLSRLCHDAIPPLRFRPHGGMYVPHGRREVSVQPLIIVVHQESVQCNVLLHWGVRLHHCHQVPDEPANIYI